MAETQLEKIKRAIKQARQASANQRQRAREDIAFQIGENQWSEEAKKERSGGIYNGVTVPARPMLSIPIIQQPKQIVLNQATTARLGINLHPVSETADKDIAEVKEGIIRRIDRDGKADQARMWALDYALQTGLGWYLITTQYDEDGDNPFDQEIVYERILYQDLVYMDPSAQKADFSDARYGGLAAWMSLDAYQEEFGEEAIPPGTSWEELATDEPDWVAGEGDQRAVLVATHYYKEFNRNKTKFGGREKESVQVTVKICKASAWKILEEGQWDGKYIPLVPVIGRELQPIGGERRWEGIIRPARDAQMVYNFAASTLVERMALEPKAPFIVAEDQLDEFEDEWKQANRRNLAFLRYKHIEGVQPPQRAQIDSTGMSLAMMALEMGKEWGQITTSLFSPNLGEAPKGRDKQSGRAILALQQQGDAGTSHFIQNLASITLPYDALIVLDLMPKIYDRPGRVTEILGGEDEAKPVMLGAPYVIDPNTGRPAPAPKGTPNADYVDLNRGKYSISIDVGKSYQTRLQEGSEEIGAILQSDPQLMPLIGATYFRFRDFPGAKEIADILKKLRARQFPGLDDDQNDPANAEAQKQALQQQLQTAQQQLSQAAKYIQTEQAKHEATIAQAQLKSQADVEIARMNNATKVLVARITAAKEASQAAKEDQEEAMALGLNLAHEAEENAADRQHEQGMAQAQAATAQAQQQDQGQQEIAQQDNQAQHDMAQAAVSQPEPQPPGA